MTPIEKLPDTWCAMWNDDPALAHDLLTPDGRQWSGATGGLDDVVGPAAAQLFIERYRRERGTRFTARTLVVDEPDRISCTWDATLRDGTVRTGADMFVLRDGLVAENWTLIGAGRAAGPDAAGSGASSRTEIAALAAGWRSAWNGTTGGLADIVTADAAIWLGADGADLRGPAELTAHIARVRAARPAIGCTPHRAAAVDVERQTVALTWTAAGAGHDGVGGIDVLVLRDGRIAQVWSIVGDRPFRY